MEMPTYNNQNTPKRQTQPDLMLGWATLFPLDTIGHQLGYMYPVSIERVKPTNHPTNQPTFLAQPAVRSRPMENVGLDYVICFWRYLDQKL